jgi:GATA-binding protein
MNPTTMEHDFRFPRRPDGRQLGDHDRRILDVSMLDKTIAAAGHRLLSTPLFPPFDEANAVQQKSISQMQQEDPLAVQVWKFFSKTKQELPNQDRMENLTWRMMAVEIRKQRAARLQQIRYAYFPTECPWVAIARVRDCTSPSFI